MLKFNEFIVEGHAFQKDLTDFDFEAQIFNGMDAMDVRNHQDAPATDEKKLTTLSEELEFSTSITEANDTRFDRQNLPDHVKFEVEKYVKVRMAKQKKLEGVYGKSDKPLFAKRADRASIKNNPHMDKSVDRQIGISENAVRAAKWFDSLAPAQQKKELNAALRRRRMAGLGRHLSGNQKNETANEVETNGRLNYTVGSSGSPAEYHHITTDGFHKVITCANATASCGGVGKMRGAGGSCLAMKAQGQQATNRASRDHYSQGEHHTTQSNTDHVITMMYELRQANKKANDDGRNLLYRGDNYTNDHDQKYDSLHRYMREKSINDGETPHERYGYTKLKNDYTDPENGNHKIYSNGGPSFKRAIRYNSKANKYEVVSEMIAPNVTRNDVMKIKTTENNRNINPNTGKSIPMNQYAVVNINRPNVGSKDLQDDVYQLHNHVMNKVKTFRSWDHFGTLVDHDDKTPDEFHHPDGYGHTTITRATNTPDGVVHKKVRYKYQDYDVITPAHDNRAADVERLGGSTKTREGGKVGLVVLSSAVSSTPKDDLENSTMFHDVRDIDDHGILHSGHPLQQEDALSNQRKIEKSPTHLAVEKHLGHELSHSEYQSGKIETADGGAVPFAKKIKNDMLKKAFNGEQKEIESLRYQWPTKTRRVK